MENEKILLAILDELKGLKEGQQAANERLTALEEGQRVANERLTALEEGQQALNDRMKVLEEQQKAMDVRINAKIDKLGLDVATTLGVITDAVDEKFNKLKIVK